MLFIYKEKSEKILSTAIQCQPNYSIYLWIFLNTIIYYYSGMIIFYVLLFDVMSLILYSYGSTWTCGVIILIVNLNSDNVFQCFMLDNVAYYKYTKCTLYYVSVLFNLGC